MKLVKNGTSKTKHLDHCAAILVHVHVYERARDDKGNTTELWNRKHGSSIAGSQLSQLGSYGWRGVDSLQCQA